MSDGDWGKFRKDRGGLIAAVFVAALFAIIAIEPTILAHRDAYNDAARNAAHYAEDAKHDIAVKCARLAGQAHDDCADEIDNAAREDQRNEYDLAAQQISAMWAAIMGGMAVVGVGLSGVGVYLIWQTWAETRAAADAGRRANEIALNSQRAWVSLSAIPTLLQNWGVGGLYIRVGFVAKNTGGSAATHLDFSCAVLFQQNQETMKELSDRLKTQVAEWRASYESTETALLIPKDEESVGIWNRYTAEQIDWREKDKQKFARPILLAAAFYRTVSEPQKLQETWRSWYLHRVGDHGENLARIEPPDRVLRSDDLCVETYHSAMTNEIWEAPADEDKGEQAEREDEGLNHDAAPE
jgi:hypothetical protein